MGELQFTSDISCSATVALLAVVYLDSSSWSSSWLSVTPFRSTISGDCTAMDGMVWFLSGNIILVSVEN